MICKFPRFTLAALIALSSPLALIVPSAPASAFQSNGLSYILFSQGSRSTSMSGSTADLDRARALRRGNEAMFYARQNGSAYIIRDPAFLARARAIFAPQEQMGARQAELGSRQAELGSRQAALGGQQARLGAQMANAAPRRSAELSRQQDELGRQQSALGRQQSVLGQRQAALGREQARLGREAQAAIRSLLADAIRRGIAQRVD